MIPCTSTWGSPRRRDVERISLAVLPAAFPETIDDAQSPTAVNGCAANRPGHVPGREGSTASASVVTGEAWSLELAPRLGRRSRLLRWGDAQGCDAPGWARSPDSGAWRAAPPLLLAGLGPGRRRFPCRGVTEGARLAARSAEDPLDPRQNVPEAMAQTRAEQRRQQISEDSAGRVVAEVEIQNGAAVLRVDPQRPLHLQASSLEAPPGDALLRHYLGELDLPAHRESQRSRRHELPNG